MDEPQKPSKLWSAVGIGLPALAAVFCIIAAIATEQQAVYFSLAAVNLGITTLALQRVYTVFCKRQSAASSPTQSDTDATQ